LYPKSTSYLSWAKMATVKEFIIVKNFSEKIFTFLTIYWNNINGQ
jgi:hypothetical protein